jgi:hypothetical protein
MTLKIHANIHAVVSRQDLTDDTVTHELEISIMGVSMRVPCPQHLLERIDEYLRGEPQTQQPSQVTARPSVSAVDGYELGFVEGYDD